MAMESSRMSAPWSTPPGMHQLSPARASYISAPIESRTASSRRVRARLEKAGRMDVLPANFRIGALIDTREQATVDRTRPEMSTPFTPAPVKPTVPLSVLESLDIRPGTIAAVDDVAGSKKLIKLTVSFGDHRRTILAGMKQERAEPRDLVGRQALFVVNLEPKRMAGEISEGMVLDIGYADGLVPALAVPEREVPDGARAG